MCSFILELLDQLRQGCRDGHLYQGERGGCYSHRGQGTFLFTYRNHLQWTVLSLPNELTTNMTSPHTLTERTDITV